MFTFYYTILLTIYISNYNIPCCNISGLYPYVYTVLSHTMYIHIYIYIYPTITDYTVIYLVCMRLLRFGGSFGSTEADYGDGWPRSALAGLRS